jgi:hypothetical protein
MYEMGAGLTIGTAGQLNGGDHYVWLSDPDSTNTSGIADSLLGGIGLNGLGGASLKTHVTGWWTGWPTMTAPLAAHETTPATKFLMLYGAAWDTDSSGAGYDVLGYGRAKLFLTRNKADLNYDGTVNFQDIGPFSGAYGSTSGIQGNYNAEADFNIDGKVNFQDIGPLSSRYGSNCSYGSP